MKKIGVTGGIGSGKTTVIDYLKRLGAQVLCADYMTHALYEKGAKGSIAIAHHFGKEYLDQDGCVDRGKLGTLVFGDESKLKELNALIHPLVFEMIETQIDYKSKIAFIDAALLIESGLYKDMDQIWLVVADRDTRIIRIVKRDHITEDQAKLRIDVQMSDKEKKKYVNEIIDNNGNVEKTYNKVKMLYRREMRL